MELIVKKTLAALTFAVATAANAVPVTIDAGTYLLTYDDSFMPTVTVGAGGGVTFSGASLLASDAGDATPTSYAVASLDSYGSNPILITVTAKAGYTITGLTESILGNYTDSNNGVSGYAVSSAAFSSFWLTSSDVQWNNAGTVVGMAQALSGKQTVSGTYTVSGALDLAGATSLLQLSAISLMASADAVGGSYATTSLSSYLLNVQTSATSVVPEPESLGLVFAGLGIVGLQLARRRGARNA
jgi:hypothetical protein